MDVAAGNIYVQVQDGLDRPPGKQRFEPGWFGRSVAELYLAADRVYASRDEPFLITETNAASIGGSQLNLPPYDGQLRQLAWAMVSRGARMIQYWHWHSIHHGAETYWGGILGHSLQPGRVYDEVSRIGAELTTAGVEVGELRPDVDIAIVWSTESEWALQFQPPLATPGGAPDTGSYRAIITAFYTGVVDAGLRPGVVAAEHLGEDPVALAARFPVLVVPALYIASDELLDLLGAYARAGGHLVLGIRTGYGDCEARARAEVAPGRLRAAAGVHYLEYSNLFDPLPVQGSELLPAATGGHATRWADDVVIDEATPIAWFDHPELGRRPVVTTNRYGEGQVTYVGTVPDPALAHSIAGFAAGNTRPAWGELPPSVTALSAANPAGERLWFLHNWSGTAVEVTAPTTMSDLLQRSPVAAGDRLELTARDVRVLREEG
jgi:beta-galactosidase